MEAVQSCLHSRTASVSCLSHFWEESAFFSYINFPCHSLLSQCILSKKMERFSGALSNFSSDPSTPTPVTESLKFRFVMYFPASSSLLLQILANCIHLLYFWEVCYLNRECRSLVFLSSLSLSFLLPIFILSLPSSCLFIYYLYLEIPLPASFCFTMSFTLVQPKVLYILR